MNFLENLLFIIIFKDQKLAINIKNIIKFMLKFLGRQRKMLN